MSPLSREASAALKGFLTLLIVLGHDELLMTNSAGEQSFVFGWLYSFHVQCFLFLPFLYGRKALNGRRALDNLAKLYVPYVWIFVVCLAINAAYTRRFASPAEYGYALVFGNITLLKQTIGFYFPWFLPAMFALLILKGLHDRGGAWPAVLGTVSAVFWISIVFAGVSRYVVGNYVPLAISQAFYSLPMALAVAALCARLAGRGTSPWLRAAAVAAFLLFSAGLYARPALPAIAGRLLFFLIPVSAFAVLYVFRDLLARCRFLRLLGTYSMPVYLTHVIVYNALVQGLSRMHAGRHPALAWGVYLLTLGISLGGSMVLKKFPRLYGGLFPSGFGRAA